MSATPVHVVAGFLGAGKTTLLLEQLRLRQGQERCAVVVNDFGEARFDAMRFAGSVPVRDIPGGCVCCTAPESLAPTLSALLAAEDPDRVFIEATGLARPADIIDTLSRSGFGDRIELAPVVVVVDPDRLLPQPPALLADQLDAASVLVANRVDVASSEGLDRFDRLAEGHYPPLLGSWKVSRGGAPREVFEVRRSGESMFFLPARDQPRHSTEGWTARSRSWPPERVFDMGGVKALLRQTGVERVKGIFHTDIGWYRLERAGGRTEAVPSALRDGSRADVIGEGEADVAALLEALDQARWLAPESDEVPVLRLVDPGGQATELTRHALAALPGQVSEVGEHVPGRAGQGVWLREVLALVAPPVESRFILVAHDGMTTSPAPVARVGDALVLHSDGGRDVPMDKGGPFRILVPPGEGDSACANVKKLARILIQAP